VAEALTRRPAPGRVRVRTGQTAVAALLAATVLAQVGYPLTGGGTRNLLTGATVVLFFAASVGHAALTRGARTAAALVAVTTGGGLLVEAVGTATGWPFGPYSYADTLGPQVLAVPVVVPLAWTMMAWPAWLVAGRLLRAASPPVRRWARVPLAGWALASWDLFLDPQMVDAGHWTWADPTPGLPGVPGVPLSNHLAWVAVATAMMAALAALTRSAGPPARLLAGPPARSPAGGTGGGDGAVLGVYLWTYASSVLAHAAFFGLPGSAAWGAVGMGTVAVPLAVVLVRGRDGAPSPAAPSPAAPSPAAPSPAAPPGR